MTSILSDTSGLFQSVLSTHVDVIRRTVSDTLTRLSQTPGATVGTPRGQMGQVPARVRLSDCCDYAQQNGLDHLSSFARAMDSSTMTETVNRIFSTGRLLIIDLGSGASLTWILMSLVAKHLGKTQEVIVVNVDHAINMHRVSLTLEEQFKQFLDDFAPSYKRRQIIKPEAINGYTQSELDEGTSVFLVLNHLLHQNLTTHLPIPEFMDIAMNSSIRVAQTAGNTNLYGVSLEPWGLRMGFGQAGLSQYVQNKGGIVTEPCRVTGSRAGKSVIGFTVPPQ
jgi:hypothetical protein